MTWRKYIPALCVAALFVVAGCNSGGDAEVASDGAEGDVAQAASRQPGPPPKPAKPRVELETNYGTLIIELDEEKAPLTVANFLEYVDSGHYDGTIFHQIVSDYVALGGAYTAELDGKSEGIAIRNEAHNGLKNLRGTVAMARELDRIDSSTCQFFVNLQDNQELDHRGRTPEDYGYCVFGRVVSGMEVVDKIARVETRSTDQFELIPVEPVVIRSAQRVGETPAARVARQPTGTTVR